MKETSSIKNLRVQRKRTKGYKMPKGVVYVGRGSKYGNPFKLQGDMVYVDAGHRRKIFSKWVCYYDGGGYTVEDVVKLFKDMLMDANSHKAEPAIRERFKYMQEHIHELKGKRVACWCNLEACCHADIIVQTANRPLIKRYFEKLNEN